MASSVSPEFLTEFAKPSGKTYRRTLAYKRRFFNTVTELYEDEAEWTLLQERDFQSIGEVRNSLDFPEINEFRQQNVTLGMKNERNQMVPHAGSTSFFGANVAVIEGFEPYRSRFQVRVGFRLPDGTDELVPIFTGLLIDLAMSGAGGAAETFLEGLDRLLVDSDAQDVSLAFTDETLIQDGSDPTVFRTASVGVGFITNDTVTGSGVIIRPAEYSIADLDEVDKPAIITFDTVPALPVKATGIKWKPNETIEDLVNDLLDVAAIGPGPTERDVEEVLFDPGIDGSKTVDSKVDWDGGSNTNGETESDPGTIKQKWMRVDDFADGDITGNPVWSTSGSVAVVANQLQVFTAAGGSPAHASVPLAENIGTWRFKMQVGFTNIGLDPFYTKNGFGLLLQDGSQGTSGYILNFSPATGSVEFRRQDPLATTLLAIVVNLVGPFTEWRITRSAAGEFKIYEGTTLRATVSDNTYTTGTHAGFFASNTGDDSVTIIADDIYFSEALDGTIAFPAEPAITMNFQKDFDILSPPTSVGTLDHLETLNGGTILIQTAWSDDGITFDSLIPIGPGDQINGTPKRHFRMDVTTTQGLNGTRPQVERLVANLTLDKIFLSLAVFKGKSVFDAIQRLAQLADYEWGFDGSGKFFFRARATAPAVVVHLTQADGIKALRDWHPGFDRVRTEGQVTYKEFFAKYGSTEAGEASPTSEQRFGKIIKREDFSDLLLANDVDIANSRARLIRDRNHRPKKRFKLDTKMVPHLELGDRIKATYLDDPKLAGRPLGDPLGTYGASFLMLREAGNVLANGLDLRVIGLTFKTDSRECEIVGEEVLT